jgi:hypothetical protein
MHLAKSKTFPALLMRLIRKLLVALGVLSAFDAAAAEISACDLIDKATASQILGRVVARGPTASRDVLADKIRTNCDFAAEGTPLTVVTATLWEFNSPSDAKSWLDQAKSPRDAAGRIEAESVMGNAAVWWSQPHAAGYVVRKDARVLEVNIRGTAAGTQPFRVTSSMRQQLRRAALRATEKL